MGILHLLQGKALVTRILTWPPLLPKTGRRPWPVMLLARGNVRKQRLARHVSEPLRQQPRCKGGTGPEALPGRHQAKGARQSSGLVPGVLPTES